MIVSDGIFRYLWYVMLVGSAISSYAPVCADSIPHPPNLFFFKKIKIYLQENFKCHFSFGEKKREKSTKTPPTLQDTHPSSQPRHSAAPRPRYWALPGNAPGGLASQQDDSCFRCHQFGEVLLGFHEDCSRNMIVVRIWSVDAWCDRLKYWWIEGEIIYSGHLHLSCKNSITVSSSTKNIDGIR